MILFSWLTARLGDYLSKIVVAVLVLLIGFMIGKFLRRVSQKFLHETDLDKTMGKLNFKGSVEEFLSRTLEYLIYFITAIIAIDRLGLTAIILYILSGAILLFIILAFFLGIKDLFPNLIAGLVLLRKDKLKKGDKIQVGDVEGKVEGIDLVETRVRTKKGDLIYVPNSLLYKQNVVVKK
ncbi:mechanosensitive ion channel [Candidatus Woesearchaeota archaeon]|nr:mechanosensitive ion channel [Candidatus Woesearchaeota archaeon]